MAKKRPDPSSPQESSIFTDGPALTAQERKAMADTAKAARKSEKREQRRQLQAALKEQLIPSSSSESRRVTVVLLVLIALVVAFAVLVLVLQIGTVAGREQRPDMTYYVNTGDMPTLGESGVSASVTQVHYTQNGGMYVRLNFANAENEPQHPVLIQVKILNDEEEVIAAASSDSIPKDYYITNGGYNAFDLYIAKKYVFIPDDPLDAIRYEVIIDTENYSTVSDR